METDDRKPCIFRPLSDLAIIENGGRASRCGDLRPRSRAPCQTRTPAARKRGLRTSRYGDREGPRIHPLPCGRGSETAENPLFPAALRNRCRRPLARRSAAHFRTADTAVAHAHVTPSSGRTVPPALLPRARVLAGAWLRERFRGSIKMILRFSPFGVDAHFSFFAIFHLSGRSGGVLAGKIGFWAAAVFYSCREGGFSPL